METSMNLVRCQLPQPTWAVHVFMTEARVLGPNSALATSQPWDFLENYLITFNLGFPVLGSFWNPYILFPFCLPNPKLLFTLISCKSHRNCWSVEGPPVLEGLAQSQGCCGHSLLSQHAPLPAPSSVILENCKQEKVDNCICPRPHTTVLYQMRWGEMSNNQNKLFLGSVCNEGSSQWILHS